MDDVGLHACTHDNVARFEIAVDEIARVNVLQAMELDMAALAYKLQLNHQTTHQLSG
jgi:Arc/MetJ family transcription regulator